MTTVKTQGTVVYFVDTTPTDPVLRKFDCPTGVTGLGSGSTDEIDITCLDATSRSFVLGLKDQGEVSIPFVFHNDSASHEGILAMVEKAEATEMIVCLSDGVTLPTLDTNNLIVPPTGRTSIGFACLIKQPAIDIAGNEVVRGTVAVRVNGDKTFTLKTGKKYVY